MTDELALRRRIAELEAQVHRLRVHRTWLESLFDDINKVYDRMAGGPTEEEWAREEQLLAEIDEDAEAHGEESE